MNINFLNLKTKKILQVLLLIIILGLLIITPFFYISKRNSLPIDKSILNELTFPIYLPSKNNPGYVDKSSVQFIEDSNALIYNVVMPNNQIIAISQTPKPIDIEVNPKQTVPIDLPTYKKEFKVGYGSARFDVWEDKKVISMLTNENTWIIFNYTGVEESTAQNVASSLERIK